MRITHLFMFTFFSASLFAGKDDIPMQASVSRPLSIRSNEGAEDSSRQMKSVLKESPPLDPAISHRKLMRTFLTEMKEILLPQYFHYFTQSLKQDSSNPGAGELFHPIEMTSEGKWLFLLKILPLIQMKDRDDLVMLRLSSIYDVLGDKWCHLFFGLLLKSPEFVRKSDTFDFFCTVMTISDLDRRGIILSMISTISVADRQMDEILGVIEELKVLSSSNIRDLYKMIQKTPRNEWGRISLQILLSHIRFFDDTNPDIPTK